MEHSGSSPPAVEADPTSEKRRAPSQGGTIATWLRETPYWAISAALHLLLLGLLLTIVLQSEQERIEEKERVVKWRPHVPERPYDPTAPRELKRKSEIPQAEKLPKAITKKKFDEIVPEIERGTDLNNPTDFHRDRDATNASIGVAGGPAGPYGARDGKGNYELVGGTKPAEDAVLAALNWLCRHQSPDGRWSCRDFTRECRQTCTNLEPERYGDGRGFAEHDVGVTGLAMLAFTGYGHTHHEGTYPEFSRALRKAVGYLKSVQVESADPALNGRYGSAAHEQWIYDHAIATMAMGEVLVMSHDIFLLKHSVTDAARLCLCAQNEGFGWRYGVRPGDNDTSVTGWMVLALKTARYARLAIPEDEYRRAFEGALSWFDRATAASGKTGYAVPGDEGSRLAKVYAEPYPYSKELSCMTAVAVLCRLFAGESRSSPTVRHGIDLLMRSPPLWQEQKGRSLSTINLYHWYYGSYALYQFDGPAWRRWNEHMQAALLPTQRQGNIDEDGSWDPIGEWGIAGGRVYSTAMGALTLEVYRRYTRSQEGIGI